MPNYNEDSRCQLAYLFAEGSGTTTADSSQNSNTGTFKGSGEPAWSSDVPRESLDYSIDLDGTDDYVDMGTHSSLNFASKFTITMWVKTTENAGMILSFRKSDDEYPAIDMPVGFNGPASSNGKFYPLMRIGNNVGLKWLLSGTINDGNWHFIALRFNQSTMDAWVDTTKSSTANIATGAITTNLRHLGVEKYWVDTNDIYSTTDRRYYDGKIAEVGIFNDALSDAEIDDIYDNGLQQTEITVSKILTTMKGIL
jgi:hypothetical protein